MTSRFNSWIKILLLAILLVVILNLPSVSGKTRNFFYSISSPIQKALWNKGSEASGFLTTFINAKNLKKENEGLKAQKLDFLTKEAEIAELKKENQTLREALEIGLEKDFSLAFGDVIGKDAGQDSILINKGSAGGITAGSAVITSQKVLVGKVSEVYESFSRIDLISNKKSVLSAEILKKEGASSESILATVRGQGNFQLLLDRIPKDQEIKEGDAIISSSLGGDLPKGFIIGEIRKVIKKDVESFQQAEIRPGFDITQLRSVFIVKKQ